jgi:hypothetical protein
MMFADDARIRKRKMILPAPERRSGGTDFFANAEDLFLEIVV